MKNLWNKRRRAVYLTLFLPLRWSRHSQRGPERCLPSLPRRWRPHRAGGGRLTNYSGSAFIFKILPGYLHKNQTLLLIWWLPSSVNSKEAHNLHDVSCDMLQLLCVVCWKRLNSCGMSCSCCYVAAPQFLKWAAWHQFFKLDYFSFLTCSSDQPN